MLHTVTYMLKSLFRKKHNSIAILSFFILSAILLFSYNHPDISIMEFLSFSMRLGQIGFAFFMFLSYECFFNVSRDEYTESISTIKGELKRVIITYISFFLLIIVAWAFLILLWQLGWYWHAYIAYFPFIIHMILAIILNCFLPSCIAVLTGAVLGLSIKRTAAYGLILIFLILSSNIPAKILYSIEINNVPILNYFDWFTVLMPNSDFVADSVYGISLEIYRWVLALGWISLLTACVLIKIDISYNSASKLKIATLIIVAVFCGIRFNSRENDSFIRKDYRSDGTLFREVTYRSKEQVGIEESPSFQISKYDIDFTIDSKMRVSAALTLSEANREEYDFTLWHDLEIIKIYSVDCNNIPYDRWGDYLTIYPPNDTEMIYIDYAGNCGKYFTNYQGIALPGYIPYYPMPGHRSLWDYNRQEIKVLQDLPKTDFFISIKSNLDVVCNLPKVCDNTFAGTAETVSIYAGILTKTTNDGLSIYKSPVSYQRNIAAGYHDQWEKLSKLVGEDRGLDLSDKIIFVQPETIMSTKSSNENLVIYDDHVILGSWSLSADSICMNYLFSLIPSSNETYLLEELFKQHIAFGSNKDYFEKPSLEELMILTKYSLSSDIEDDVEWSEYMSAIDSYENLWKHQILSLGEDLVIKSVYQYLISTDRHQNQIEFLYTLGVN